MGTYLEIWSPDGARLIPLGGDKLSLGSSELNDVTVPDAAVSRLHCAFVRYAGGWTLRDLESANGTYLNGQRLWGEHPVWPGDEIVVGSTRMCLLSDDPSCSQHPPEVYEPPPELTRRERDVVVALCRPLAEGGVFTNPASVQEVAQALEVTEAAVRQHLLRLAQKLRVSGEGEQRRSAIANEAIRRGLVQIRHLRRL